MTDSEATQKRRTAAGAFFKITLPSYIAITVVMIGVLGRLDLGEKALVVMVMASAIVTLVVLWVIAGIQWRAEAKSTLGNVASKAVSVLLYLLLANGIITLIQQAPWLAESIT